MYAQSWSWSVSHFSIFFFFFSLWSFLFRPVRLLLSLVPFVSGVCCPLGFLVSAVSAWLSMERLSGPCGGRLIWGRNKAVFGNTCVL